MEVNVGLFPARSLLSIDIAKELSQWVTLDSELCYIKIEGSSLPFDVTRMSDLSNINNYRNGGILVIPAPTSDEIERVLPSRVVTSYGYYDVVHYKLDGNYITGLVNLDNRDCWKEFIDEEKSVDTKGNCLISILSDGFEVDLTGKYHNCVSNHIDKCELVWCKSGRPATKTVIENIGDGAFSTSICETCFNALTLKPNQDLPEASVVREVLTKRYRSYCHYE